MKPDLAANMTPENTTLPPSMRRAVWGLAAFGAVALGIAFALSRLDENGLRYFYHAYLVSFTFYLSISLGALFFVMLQHATRAAWSVTVRRLAEIVSANIVYLAVLFLPILLPMFFGESRLYEWVDAEVMAEHEVLAHKSPYLNVPFFSVRCAIYFIVWIGMAFYFRRQSLAQDTSGDPALTVRMERFSPVALLLFAASVTFASFDWLMSLEPAWFSTIFGLYFYSGTVVAFLAVVILFALALNRSNCLVSIITVEHYHDLGKLLFAFVVFWGYIAFSQYMLIWYANIPEETVWYLARQDGPWAGVSIVLLFGHLLIPLLGLVSRSAKRKTAILAFWALWMLVFHWIDIYWLVMPSLDAEQLPGGLVDVCCLVGLGGLYLAGTLHLAGDRPLVPLKDPRLGDSLAFENF